MLRTEITISHRNNRICQHCSVKTTTVTPSFYYVFNISLPCNINIPSFIGNLWRVILQGNHLMVDGTSFSDAGSLVTTAHLTREICPRDLKYRKSKTNMGAQKLLTYQAPVVRRLDNAIHRLNRYPVDKS